MTLGSGLNQFLFGVYPYICLAVFFFASLIRFDRDQYTWKSDSSQLLRARELRWGSNLFHFGVLFIFFGHLFGLLTPHWAYAWAISAGHKQLLAMVSGGLAGVFAILGVSLLLHRRIADPRISSNTRPWDIAILVILWVQLALGLTTVGFSSRHLDGGGFSRIVGIRDNLETEPLSEFYCIEIARDQRNLRPASPTMKGVQHILQHGLGQPGARRLIEQRSQPLFGR